MIQYEPSVIGHCMFDNVEKSVQANQLLKEAAENAFWQVCSLLIILSRFSHLMDHIIDEAIQDSELHKLPMMCASTSKCLNLVQVAS